MQYNDNVVGAGSPKYDNAYFEINYVRAYTTGGPAPTSLPHSKSAYRNGSNTAVTVPAPTGIFAGPTNMVNTSPTDAVSRSADMNNQFMVLVGHALFFVIALLLKRF
jgi:hypothetical protein